MVRVFDEPPSMRETPTLWMPSDGCLISLSFALVLRRSGGRRLSTAAACCHEFGEERPGIAVLPRLDVDLCRRLRAVDRSPALLAAAIDAEEARRALDLGLEGVLDMDTALEELPRAIDELAAGGRWISPSLACRLGHSTESPACGRAYARDGRGLRSAANVAGVPTRA
jgi:hypothetical protein